MKTAHGMESPKDEFYYQGMIDPDFSVELVRAWALDRAKVSGKQTTDLGKFFFGVSSFFIGLLIALIKLSSVSRGLGGVDQGPSIMAYRVAIGISFFAFLASSAVAVQMVIPRHLHLTAESRLADEMKCQNQRLHCYLWWYLMPWAVGVLSCGALALMTSAS